MHRTTERQRRSGAPDRRASAAPRHPARASRSIARCARPLGALAIATAAGALGCALATGGTGAPDDAGGEAGCSSTALTVVTTHAVAPGTFAVRGRGAAALVCWTERLGDGRLAARGARLDGCGARAAPVTLATAAAGASTPTWGACVVRDDAAVDVAFRVQSGPDTATVSIQRATLDGAVRLLATDLPLTWALADGADLRGDVVGDESWFEAEYFVTTVGQWHWQAVVDRANPAGDVQTDTFRAAEEVRRVVPVHASEVYGGEDGGWLVTRPGGEMHVAWMPGRPDAPRASAVSVAADRVPLAAHGRELVLAVPVDATHWRLEWLAPGDTDPRPGPMLDLASAPGGGRLGARAEADALLVAGVAAPGTPVAVWAVPWDPVAGPPTLRGRASAAPVAGPLRIALARLDTQLIAVWSEPVAGDDATVRLVVAPVASP